MKNKLSDEDPNSSKSVTAANTLSNPDDASVTLNTNNVTNTNNIPSRNILCLGMSYIHHRHIISEFPEQELIHKTTGVKQAIELTRRNMITGMDGRDLSRIIALESLSATASDNANDNDGKMSLLQSQSVTPSLVHEFEAEAQSEMESNAYVESKSDSKPCYQAYTVSMEEGDIYKPNRHYTGNFNRGSGFVQRMMEHYECNQKYELVPTKKQITFSKIILDYFWIPSGTWSMDHWKRSFFVETLPSFVSNDIFCPISILREEAAVYLPFCIRCFSQVLAAQSVLSKYYEISFLKKDQLNEVELWRATQTIDAEEMQSWLGKKRDQEEIYCTITSADCKGVMLDQHGNELLDILNRIPNVENTRMIKLRVLKKNDGEKNITKEGSGGIIGLLPPPEAKSKTKLAGNAVKKRKIIINDAYIREYWDNERSQDNNQWFWQSNLTETFRRKQAASSLCILAGSPSNSRKALCKEAGDPPENLWYLDGIFSVKSILTDAKCQEDGCNHAAVSQWISSDAPDYVTYRCCLVCQKKYYKGFPYDDHPELRSLLKNDKVHKAVREKLCNPVSNAKWRGPMAENEMILFLLGCKICTTWEHVSKFVGSRRSGQLRAKGKELNVSLVHGVGLRNACRKKKKRRANDDDMYIVKSLDVNASRTSNGDNGHEIGEIPSSKRNPCNLDELPEVMSTSCSSASSVADETSCLNSSF